MKCEVIDICGDIFYLKNNKLHREEGPAIIYKNGIIWWMNDGKLHRENGPAIINKKELIEYWIYGQPATEEEIINIKRNKWIDKFFSN